MALPVYQQDEPLTPAGRLFLQPETEQIINVAFFSESPADIPKLTAAVESSLALQHPRFNSLLVRDGKGVQKWRKIKLNLSQHIMIIDTKTLAASKSCSGIEAAAAETTPTSQVNAYLADLSVSCPLSYDKPLWELHLLVDQNCAVLRIHHALGDGISLMSLFIASCKRVDEPDLLPTFVSTASSHHSTNQKVVRKRGVLEFLKFVWFTIVFVLKFIGRTLWIKDTKTVFSGGDGVQLWTRKLATARFLIDDLKTVKQAIPNGTINDVLFGIISLGLSKYLDFRSPNALSEGVQLTGMAMVNLRKQPGLQELTELMKTKSKSRWGNKFGVVLLPVYYHKAAGSSPLQYINRAKPMLDRKKQTLEAHFSYLIGDLVMSLFGAKVTSRLNHRVVCNTTFTVSNMAGPKEELTFGGNKITSLNVTSSSLAHAITMHMLSYAGKAEMQILTAKDIIPDPEVLAKFFEDTLAEMKDAAAAVLRG